MYEVKFSATTSADWIETVELIDNETDLPLEGIDTASFNLAVSDRQGCIRLTASTTDGSIERLADSILKWTFPQTTMAGLCDQTTYNVGLVMTLETGSKIQLLIGSLAMFDGVVTND